MSLVVFSPGKLSSLFKNRDWHLRSCLPVRVEAVYPSYLVSPTQRRPSRSPPRLGSGGRRATLPLFDAPLVPHHLLCQDERNRAAKPASHGSVRSLFSEPEIFHADPGRFPGVSRVADHKPSLPRGRSGDSPNAALGARTGWLVLLYRGRRCVGIPGKLAPPAAHVPLCGHVPTKADGVLPVLAPCFKCDSKSLHR